MFINRREERRLLLVSNAIIAVPKHFSSSSILDALVASSFFSIFRLPQKEKKGLPIFSLSRMHVQGLKMLFSYFSASKVNKKQTAINKIRRCLDADD